MILRPDVVSCCQIYMDRTFSSAFLFGFLSLFLYIHFIVNGMYIGPVLIWFHKTCVLHLTFRKMRNRDAAVRSRERKKMYVKNLEMKSRYLEGECRKLGHLLQCCYAENHALRLCLQSSGAFGASMTKLESAVLLLGEAYERHFLCLIVVVLCGALQFKSQVDHHQG